jgi:hypothetical protein
VIELFYCAIAVICLIFTIEMTGFSVHRVAIFFPVSVKYL